jgi:cytochrome c biogenesis protein CcmG/thiol:disulfide interchange protein DsbE
MTENLIQNSPESYFDGEETAAAPSHEEALAAAKQKRNTRLWQLLIIVVLVVFVAFLAVGLNRTNVSEQRASGTAPDFTFTTFDGEEISLDDLAGQGVVLNFWASWCEPCKDEAELLEQTWRREQGNGIIFLGLDYLDQEHAALEYLEEFDVTYPNGTDKQSAAARSYGIKGVPETFFIGPDGEIKSTVIGPIVSPGDLNERLDAIRP